ncbi:HindIII family type II restriction endonuclease [Fusobacterium animalis]|uniref:HindIII family type II restriction endonuclease n=1 Tax=Fusobacterium animalis TaxID=76859 RepID=UPI0039659647
MRKDKNSFISDFNNRILEIIKVKKIDKTFNEILNKQIRSLINRGEIEKNFWKEEENRINSLSHKEAIEELIKVKKLNNKIKQIDKYIGDLKKYV